MAADTQESRASAGARLAAKRAAKAARKAAQREANKPEEPTGVDPADQHDEIMETVEQASGWVTQNRAAIWGTVAILVLAGVGIVTFMSQRDKGEQEATRSLADGTATALAPIVPEAEAAEAEELKLETYPTLSARAKEALANYRATEAGFAETGAAWIARLGEANSLLELEKYGDAEAAYRKASSAVVDDGSPKFLQFRALEGLGFSLEGQEKYADARATFDKLSGMAEGVEAAQAGIHVARMWIAEGNRDEAIKRLKAVLTTAESAGDGAATLYASLIADVELRLAELGAPQPKKAPPGLEGLPPELLEQLKGQLGAH